MAAVSASAQTPGSLTVTLPESTDTLVVAPVPVSDYFGSNGREALLGLADTIVVTGNATYTVPLDPEEALAVFVAPVGSRASVVYAAPGETLTLDLTKPLAVMTGSPLVEGMTRWNAVADSIVGAYNALPATATDEERSALRDSFTGIATDMAIANADNALGVYMISQLQDDAAMLKAFEALGPGASSSILAPLYERVSTFIARKRAILAAAEAIKPGLPAPGFTLPDREGNMVSLSEFKGKWVMLDFWGSWCGWCIKGIPQMKEQWSELKDRDVVFLSIACNDSKDTWLAALDQYDLPWVNVWSDPATPSAESVQGIYAVQGYPTKLVIDPQGNIALIVVGEDPTFYNQLRALL